MPVEPREASSLLVARDGDGGPELYMVRRHPRSPFMANALVFVGGRVDAADRSDAILARCRGLEGQAATERLGCEAPASALGHYVAALRECFEEAGLLVAEGELPDARTLGEMRDRLNDDRLGFSELLAGANLTLPLDRLRYLDHWITPEFEHRRYDTRFFVCTAPEGQEASFDPRETTHGAWMTVDRILDGNGRGELHLAPPTLVILEGLWGCNTLDELLSRAPDRPLPFTMPRPLIARTKHPTLLLPGDHRYDDPDSVSGPVHCVELVEGTWIRRK